MIIPFVKTVKDYTENFFDEMLVTIFDTETGLTLASLEAIELKEKGIFDDYPVKYFNHYNKNVVLLGVTKNEGNNKDNSKQIS